MEIATFANKYFEVSGDKICTFQDFQYSSSLQTEKQDASGSKPSTYNKGPDLDNMSFKVHLDVAYGVNPRNEWEEWRDLLNSGDAYPFIMGGRPLGDNRFQLVGVTKSNVNTDNCGNYVSLDLELKFDEYVREGSEEASKKKSTSSKDKGVQGLSDAEFASLIEE
jgi:hypothetical protein